MEKHIICAICGAEIISTGRGKPKYCAECKMIPIRAYKKKYQQEHLKDYARRNKECRQRRILREIEEKKAALNNGKNNNL